MEAPVPAGNAGERGPVAAIIGIAIGRSMPPFIPGWASRCPCSRCCTARRMSCGSAPWSRCWRPAPCSGLALPGERAGVGRGAAAVRRLRHSRGSAESGASAPAIAVWDGRTGPGPSCFFWMRWSGSRSPPPSCGWPSIFSRNCARRFGASLRSRIRPRMTSGHGGKEIDAGALLRRPAPLNSAAGWARGPGAGRCAPNRAARPGAAGFPACRCASG